jgi:hypothetical protein
MNHSNVMPYWCCASVCVKAAVRGSDVNTQRHPGAWRETQAGCNSLWSAMWMKSYLELQQYRDLSGGGIT